MLCRFWYSPSSSWAFYDQALAVGMRLEGEVSSNAGARGAAAYDMVVLPMASLRKYTSFHMASISMAHSDKCSRCGSALVHLEWHERTGAQVQYLWRCWNCKNEFVTLASSDETDPPAVEITKLFFTSLLV